jgi:hypothetical protein
MITEINQNPKEDCRIHGANVPSIKEERVAKLRNFPQQKQEVSVTT